MASNEIEVTPYQRRWSMDEPLRFKEQRIVLIGSRGSAQFITSNCILGRQVFTPDKWSLLQSLKNHGEMEDRKLSVINAPNFSEDLTQSHIKKELERCVCLSSPGPHAVLLALDLEDISPADIRIVKELTEYFGDDILNYTILLLCHEGEEEDLNLEDRLQKDINLGQIMDKCGHRYHLFQKDSIRASCLLEKLDIMVTENGDQSFSNNNYKKTEDSIRQEETFIKKGRGKEIRKRLCELDGMYQGEELERERDQYLQSVEADIREKAETVILDRLGFAHRTEDYAAAVHKDITVGALRGAVPGLMGGTWTVVRAIMGGIAVGIAVGTSGGIAGGIVGGITVGIAVGIAVAIAMGAAGETVGGIAGGTAKGMAVGIYGGMAVGMAVGITMGITGRIAGEIAVGIVVGIYGGIVGVIAVGITAFVIGVPADSEGDVSFKKNK